MTLDPQAPTRRSLRLRRREAPAAEPVVPGARGAVPDPAAEPAPAEPEATPSTAAEPEAAEPGLAPSVPVVIPSRALPWVDELTVAALPGPQLHLGTAGFVPVTPDLLARAPRRTPWRPGVLVPAALILALVCCYCLTVLLWPLYAVAPVVSAYAPQPAAAAAALPTWPSEGAAAVSVDGVGTPLTSTGDAIPMASITKVVTALLVLDAMPLAVGEQGPSYSFVYSDRVQYWDDLGADESALDVPVGGSLTEYQLLQGMLIGSAGNYARTLAAGIWSSDAVYADAANTWLRQHGVEGITVVEPTGIDYRNVATPQALLTLARRAMANPVIAEIVGTHSVELPGAGLVTNTNALLGHDAGVVGIKTGSLDFYNLLSAKDITIGDTTVRVYADVLGQPTTGDRDAWTRALFAQIEQELQLTPSIPAGTTVGQVDTLWGDPVGIVTASDASVVLWNGAVPTASTSFDLGDARDAGDAVGSLTLTGPLDTDTVDVHLAGDVEGPSFWWRLTHPLELWGLN